MFRHAWSFIILSTLVISASKVWAAPGTEGASFLDIPVGAGPAALGSAYTAVANDAYAPVWNPGGLGFLNSFEFAGMHLNYLGPFRYEFASFVLPFGEEDAEESMTGGLGGAVQYVGSGDIQARDVNGNPAGSFTTSFAAYTLSYGQRIARPLSLGASVKYVQEKISDASANAYATDVGFLYKPTRRLSFGGAMANLGTKLKFMDDADPLPMAGRLGACYRIESDLDIAVEGALRKNGLASGGVGIQWLYADLIALRAGYNTAHTRGLGAISGVTAGAAFFLWGQEFAYAWVPFGELGNTHYFSLVLRTSVKSRPGRPESSEDFENLKDLLNEHDRKALE
jgi:hypothetical protein